MALWNNLDTVAGKPKSLGHGQIQSITFTGTGTGYTNGASFTISAPPAGGVQAVATAVVVGGAVTGFTITNPGMGYTSAPTVTLGGGSGQTFGSVIYGKAKVAGITQTGITDTVVFLDRTEAQVAQNRAKGLKLPGWNRYMEYVDNTGATRYKVENLVAMSVLPATSGDLEDAVAVDATFTVTTQPTNQSTVTGAATFTVAATGATSYQWQVRAATGGQYVNIVNGAQTIGSAAGATTASLALTGQTAGATGQKYRCQIFNTTSGSAVTSTAATLTFGT
jgi:hypothetical protein